MMNRIILIVTLALLVGLSQPLYGREKGDLPGEDAPEYERILDIGYWLKAYSPESLMEMFDIDFDGHERIVARTVEDIFGCKDWKQGDLKATTYKGDIYIKSEMEYRGFKGDDSLCALLTHWEPGTADIIKGFSRDNLLAMYAFGNPTGFFDIFMEWLIETDALWKFLDSLPFEDEEPFIKLLLKNLQMTAKGYWYEAKEEIYPLLGDEKVIAVYPNEEFEEMLMARFIVAMELEGPGLADMVTKAFEEYLWIYSEIFFGFGLMLDDYDEYLEVKTLTPEGYVIHYVNFNDLVKIGWTEYGGAFFVSDPTTLLDLPKYFDPSLPNSVWFDEYNEYLYIDAAGIADEFYEPFKGIIKDELEWMLYYDDDSAGIIEDLLSMLGSRNLGEAEFLEVINGNEALITMKADKKLADLMLQATHYSDYLLDEGPGIEFGINQYLDFYGGKNRLK